ncbi:MAG: D-hexose-6-phosphate mutarotase [Halioglobus sp.]
MSISSSDSAKTYNKPGLPLIVVDNTHCHAVIAPQGAHLVEFKQKSGIGNCTTPLLWLSPNATFTPGKAIRGGIPICFPWFGPHSKDPSLPQHGFARIRNWQLSKSAESVDATELTFVLESCEETLRAYPHAFIAELHFTLGETLTIELTVTNRSDSTMPVGWALHSYFPVSDPATATVPELLGSRYVDKIDNSRVKQLVENLDFSHLTDTVFNRSPDKITLSRPEGQIVITCENAPTTIAWNPNAGADAIADLGPEIYSQFVCVERGAASDDLRQLPVGETMRARMNIRALCN